MTDSSPVTPDPLPASKDAGDERARSILESITDAFFAVDKDWRFTYLNPQAERLLNRASGELVGRSIWDEYPGLHGSEFEAMYRRVAADRVAANVTSYYSDHDRWYEVHTYPSLHDGGISIYFRDVSERKRASDALRESNALLRGISDSTGDVIFAKDLQGRMRFANPAALSLIGKALEQVLGKTDVEFLDDKEAGRAVMENDRRIMQSGVAADVEEAIPLPDGTRRVWLSRKMPNRDAAGHVIGLLGVSRDITDEKRRAERILRLYNVAAALSEAVATQDVARVALQQGIAAVGASAGSLALLAEDGFTLTMAGSIGYPQAMIDPWNQFTLDTPIPLAETVRTGQPVYIESPDDRLKRYPILTQLNATRLTQSSACIPLTIGGKTVGALGLSFDRPGGFPPEDREFLMSLGRQCAQSLERARLLEKERAARAQAEHASGMKDEFLATLSHELRTPLNAILGWSTILAGGKSDDAELRDGLEAIQRNARTQTQIIEDLLDMSRIISGKLRLDVQRLDLANVVRAAIETVRPAAEVKGVRVRVLLDPQAGPVSGDPGRLQQVFWNLLTNAVKFTPKGGQVQVLLERVNSHLEVTVADTGEGIGADFLPFVFDRFRQADSSTTRRHGGLGIGLSIVKQLVDLHGGTVRVKSPGVGMGSTFIVALPLTVMHADPSTDREPRRHPSACDASPAPEDNCQTLRGLRALVVDDEPDARDLVKRLLEGCHAVVKIAASADEAMASIANDPPDVLISDIGMAGEDGYSLIRRVRELPRDRGGRVPAVALTAYARSEDRIRAIRAGFQTHVVKPFEPAELIAVVASIAGRSPGGSTPNTT